MKSRADRWPLVLLFKIGGSRGGLKIVRELPSTEAKIFGLSSDRDRAKRSHKRELAGFFGRRAAGKPEDFGLCRAHASFFPPLDAV